eukprot:TRINITY_DN133_c0_g1_i1.p1 TRINITY_DN133_c0_g1~~TRINITY_DN133_c0_g1_i1.p1  ORF type:complete len:106 (-),score=23.03 TRINITY_DN133_c0_g1_i1:53-370(-)
MGEKAPSRLNSTGITGTKSVTGCAKVARGQALGETCRLPVSGRNYREKPLDPPSWTKRKTAHDESHAGLPRTPVSYTHLRAHETVLDLVCRLLLEKKKKKISIIK